jgi:hypothetical protein
MRAECRQPVHDSWWRNQNWKMLCAHRPLQMRLKTVWRQSTDLALRNPSPVVQWLLRGDHFSDPNARFRPLCTLRHPAGAAVGRLVTATVEAAANRSTIAAQLPLGRAINSVATIAV